MLLTVCHASGESHATLTLDDRYGWCGNTPQHCGVGCISGCSSGAPPPVNPGTTPRSDGRCGSSFGGATCDPNGPYGACCSQYGYVFSVSPGMTKIGESDVDPEINRYCGSTPGHCLVENGCQNGCTDGPGGNTGGGAASSTAAEPVIGGLSTTMPPGAAATGPVTTDGKSLIT